MNALLPIAPIAPAKPAKKLQWRFVQNGLQKGLSPRTWWEAASMVRDSEGRLFRWRIQRSGSHGYSTRLSDYPLGSFRAPATTARRLGLAMQDCQEREDRLVEVLNRCRVREQAVGLIDRSTVRRSAQQPNSLQSNSPSQEAATA